MISAYSELYLDDSMKNLGDMIEYSICDLGLSPDVIWGYFISSGIASCFEKGNPKYIAGMSGIELAKTILDKVGVSYVNASPSYREQKGVEFWSGWILAYYQWLTGMRFEDMAKDGLSLSDVFSLYIFHESDESKFVEAANNIIERNKKDRQSKLATIRKARGLTQSYLSYISGVSLRMIQLYEQRQNDISKAQITVVIRLSKALGCDVEDILD